jgi:CO/xanthine dehydrogenase Mo-binding subunit
MSYDCELIINPGGLQRYIEAKLVQGSSRGLSEEVAFDRAEVTSVDWTRYPILGITEAPEEVDIVLLNRTELAPGSARSSRPSPMPSLTRQACGCAARP